ncbi:MAG: glycosyltransferase family 2 protein [Bacteroidota bacterium]|nr:glycosyltransferase family 2 protein [Bacteroidota bacterium]MDP4190586.1 glycosyltransferase family 2 protein [Bacteroidota bacterium]MDP4194245.1 glycosyltransferase family 2 protein [Bacteroidota bacterium]
MFSDEPLVSFGMPVYNGENYIREAIESVLSQSFKDFVLIISDNASIDKTQLICQEYAKRDNRIRYYRNETNVGAARNFNRVFELSHSKYFKWVSHDDGISPDYLEKSVNIMESNPDVVLCYARTLAINYYNNQQEKSPYELRLMHEKASKRFTRFMRIFRYESLACDPIMGLIRSDVLKQTKLLGNYLSADTILLSELALRGKFYEIGEYLYIKRIHPNMSRKKNPSVKDISEWFDPSNKGKIHLPRWKFLFEYMSAIKHAPINDKEKTVCYFEVVKWALIISKSMGADLVMAIEQIYNIWVYRKKTGLAEK